MAHNPPHAPSSDRPEITCDEARALLNQWWDGEETPLLRQGTVAGGREKQGTVAGKERRDSLASHLESCCACQRWQSTALRVQQVLTTETEPTVPFGLAHRIAQAVNEDRAARSRRRVQMTIGGLVAASLLAGTLVLFSLPRHREAPAPMANQFNPSTKKGSGPRSPKMDLVELRSNLAKAGEEVIEWTRQTADETVAQTKQVFPKLPDIRASAEVPTSDRPLAEMKNGATVAFQPITDSARKAFRLFISETPGEPGEGFDF